MKGTCFVPEINIADRAFIERLLINGLVLTDSLIFRKKYVHGLIKTDTVIFRKKNMFVRL